MYRVAPSVILEVESQGGHLRVTYGQTKGVFVAQLETQFSRDDDSITFHVSDTAVSHLTLFQAQTHAPQSKVEAEARKIETRKIEK